MIIRVIDDEGTVLRDDIVAWIVDPRRSLVAQIEEGLLKAHGGRRKRQSGRGNGGGGSIDVDAAADAFAGAVVPSHTAPISRSTPLFVTARGGGVNVSHSIGSWHTNQSLHHHDVNGSAMGLNRTHRPQLDGAATDRSVAAAQIAAPDNNYNVPSLSEFLSQYTLVMARIPVKYPSGEANTLPDGDDERDAVMRQRAALDREIVSVLGEKGLAALAGSSSYSAAMIRPSSMSSSRRGSLLDGKGLNTASNDSTRHHYGSSLPPPPSAAIAAANAAFAPQLGPSIADCERYIARRRELKALAEQITSQGPLRSSSETGRLLAFVGEELRHVVGYGPLSSSSSSGEGAKKGAAVDIASDAAVVDMALSPQQLGLRAGSVLMMVTKADVGAPRTQQKHDGDEFFARLPPRSIVAPNLSTIMHSSEPSSYLHGGDGRYHHHNHAPPPAVRDASAYGDGHHHSYPHGEAAIDEQYGRGGYALRPHHCGHYGGDLDVPVRLVDDGLVSDVGTEPARIEYTTHRPHSQQQQNDGQPSNSKAPFQWKNTIILGRHPDEDEDGDSAPPPSRDFVMTPPPPPHHHHAHNQQYHEQSSNNNSTILSVHYPAMAPQPQADDDDDLCQGDAMEEGANDDEAAVSEGPSREAPLSVPSSSNAAGSLVAHDPLPTPFPATGMRGGGGGGPPASTPSDAANYNSIYYQDHHHERDGSVGGGGGAAPFPLLATAQTGLDEEPREREVDTYMNTYTADGHERGGDYHHDAAIGSGAAFGGGGRHTDDPSHYYAGQRRGGASTATLVGGGGHERSISEASSQSSSLSGSVAGERRGGSIRGERLAGSTTPVMGSLAGPEMTQGLHQKIHHRHRGPSPGKVRSMKTPAAAALAAVPPPPPPPPPPPALSSSELSAIDALAAAIVAVDKRREQQRLRLQKQQQGIIGGGVEEQRYIDEEDDCFDDGDGANDGAGRGGSRNASGRRGPSVSPSPSSSSYGPGLHLRLSPEERRVGLKSAVKALLMKAALCSTTNGSGSGSPTPIRLFNPVASAAAQHHHSHNHHRHGAGGGSHCAIVEAAVRDATFLPDHAPSSPAAAHASASSPYTYDLQQHAIVKAIKSGLTDDGDNDDDDPQSLFVKLRVVTPFLAQLVRDVLLLMGCANPIRAAMRFDVGAKYSRYIHNHATPDTVRAGGGRSASSRWVSPPAQNAAPSVLPSASAPVTATLSEDRSSSSSASASSASSSPSSSSDRSSTDYSGSAMDALGLRTPSDGNRKEGHSGDEQESSPPPPASPSPLGPKQRPLQYGEVATVTSLTTSQPSMLNAVGNGGGAPVAYLRNNPPMPRRLEEIEADEEAAEYAAKQNQKHQLPPNSSSRLLAFSSSLPTPYSTNGAAKSSPPRSNDNGTNSGSPFRTHASSTGIANVIPATAAGSPLASAPPPPLPTPGVGAYRVRRPLLSESPSGSEGRGGMGGGGGAYADEDEDADVMSPVQHRNLPTSLPPQPAEEVAARTAAALRAGKKAVNVLMGYRDYGGTTSASEDEREVNYRRQQQQQEAVEAQRGTMGRGRGGGGAIASAARGFFERSDPDPTALANPTADAPPPRSELLRPSGTHRRGDDSHGGDGDGSREESLDSVLASYMLPTERAGPPPPAPPSMLDAVKAHNNHRSAERSARRDQSPPLTMMGHGPTNGVLKQPMLNDDPQFQQQRKTVRFDDDAAGSQPPHYTTYLHGPPAAKHSQPLSSSAHHQPYAILSRNPTAAARHIDAYVGAGVERNLWERDLVREEGIAAMSGGIVLGGGGGDHHHNRNAHRGGSVQSAITVDLDGDDAEGAVAPPPLSAPAAAASSAGMRPANPVRGRDSPPATAATSGHPPSSQFYPFVSAFSLMDDSPQQQQQHETYQPDDRKRQQQMGYRQVVAPPPPPQPEKALIADYSPPFPRQGGGGGIVVGQNYDGRYTPTMAEGGGGAPTPYRAALAAVADAKRAAAAASADDFELYTPSPVRNQRRPKGLGGGATSNAPPQQTVPTAVAASSNGGPHSPVKRDLADLYLAGGGGAAQQRAGGAKSPSFSASFLRDPSVTGGGGDRSAQRSPSLFGSTPSITSLNPNLMNVRSNASAAAAAPTVTPATRSSGAGANPTKLLPSVAKQSFPEDLLW